MRLPVSPRQIPIAVAGLILAGLIGLGAVRFEHFASFPNLANLLGDYAYVGIASVGATFVILSGGIDLSVGSLVAFTSVLTADLIRHGWHPLAASALCLVLGAAFGRVTGWLVRFFALPAFIVTLAGMFGLRAACFLIAGESVSIEHPFLRWVSSSLELDAGAGVAIPLRSLLLLAVVVVGFILARSTRFGRNVYAVGGNERAAQMMGVPVGATTIWVYTLAGFCSALAGLVFTFYKQAGDPTSAVGLELSVVASVVIGGTLLSGGVGSIPGTLLGVLILGVIRLLIDFEGNLNSAWTSIAIGSLLLGFIGLQKLIGEIGLRSTQTGGSLDRAPPTP